MEIAQIYSHTFPSKITRKQCVSYKIMLYAVFTKYLSRQKIFRFSTLCKVLSDHLGRIHNKSHSISNIAVVATTRNGILTRKKNVYSRKKKEKKISGNFRASHCIRNKGLCYIFFAFFRKALGNTFSTLTRKKKLQKCSFLLQVERHRRVWTSFFF